MKSYNLIRLSSFLLLLIIFQTFKLRIFPSDFIFIRNHSPRGWKHKMNMTFGLMFGVLEFHWSNWLKVNIPIVVAIVNLKYFHELFPIQHRCCNLKKGFPQCSVIFSAFALRRIITFDQNIRNFWYVSRKFSNYF